MKVVDSNAFSRVFDFNSEITVVSNDDRWACDCDLWPDVAWLSDPYRGSDLETAFWLFFLLSLRSEFIG